MNKSYRGWKIDFDAGRPIYSHYIATKKISGGACKVSAASRVRIERAIERAIDQKILLIFFHI